MAINRDLPSYEAQFGVAFKQGEAARSVHSPAAYLADLLQLLDDYFASPDLDSRRSDLRKVPLDADHTFSLVPYLDIVNELLEARVLSEDIDETRQSVKQQAYEILKSAKYPFNLPFDLAEEEVKTYLKTFDVSRESLYKAFSLQADPTMIARLYLGLSPAMAKVLTTDLEMIGSAPTETALAELNACYNNVNFIELEQVSVFLKTTGISGLELRELLYQRLSTQELGLAKQFFINQGLAGYAKLSDLEDQLKWVGSDLEEGPIPIQWFSRVNRILRLSQQTGLSLSDLDLILRSCCDNHLDETAFQYIAIIKQIADNYDLAIDVVCSFFSNMNAIGQGDGDAPVDLFNRIFNENFIELDGQYFQASDFLPNSYQALGEANKLPLTGDLFSVSNADTQKRLLKALHLSADDLRLLVTTLQQKLSGVSLPQDLLSTLSLYYRVSTLAQTLDITLQDLFNLFDLLQQDPATRQSANFNPLIHFSIEALNCYEIIVGGRIKESMWLIQMLFALVTWMQKAQFSSAELNRIKTGTYQNPMEQLAAEKKTIAGLNTLYQQLKPFLFDATHFISEQVDERTARVLYKSLVADPRGLVSSQNYRLLKAHPGKAEQAMYQALNQLQKVYPQDFVGLGIQEKLQDKIFVNLILNGYLQTDGTLIEEKWPKRADDLMISHQFENEAVFDLIHGIYQSLSEAHPSDEGLDTFSVFLTDLNELYLCANHKTSHKASRKQELYDNLIYNGYLDAEGTVLDVSFFAESENRHTFESTVSINDYGHKIYTVIQAKIAAFDRAECQLDEILFSTLPLKEIEVVDLIENLKFNDYIDENNIVLNKAQLLELKVDQFNLVLRFYPHRHQILAIIQQHLQTLKAQHYILTKEDFSQISDEIVADDIYADLKDSYLDGDNFTEDSLEFFAEAENLDNFGLGQYFDDSARAIVFKAIRRMVSVSQTYLLTADDFADLAFTDDELFELFEQMVEQAYIEADGSLTPSQTTYFLNVNNALDFQLKGFEDFHKDIFFIGHALAKVRDERIQMLVSDYMTLAQQQEDTLLAVLQDLFEIPADVVDVICRHVFEADGDLVEQFVVPILAALDTNERILKKPDNCRFNIAFNRIQQFAWLVAKLDLNAVETDIIFRDQSLVEKFSEKLTLPEGLGQFDGLVCLTVDSTHFPDIEIATIDPPPSLEAIFLYQAQGEPMEQRYWLYSADDYQLLTKAETDLSKISPLLTARSLDAAFNDASGNVWMMSGADFFYQKKGDLNWEKIEKELGKVKSNFGPSNQIDAAFVDHDDKIYVFSGDQYLRSSGELENIDDGYPKKIQGNWAQEHGLPLPTAYHESIDAAILSPNDNLYFFKDKQFISSADFNREIDISQVWGQVNNNFAESPKLDAALSLNHQVYFFAGDQCLTWAYSLENEQGLADEGSIQSLSTLIPDLPDVFQEGVDAVFRGFDDSIHIFKDRNSLQCSLDFVVEDESTALNEIWGKVENAIASTGIISAAFSGLDGKVYLFSGTQYFRYSGSNYAYVDEGYPKTIADHWGGLNTVDVAFILDGKTYLLGRDLEDNTVYVRYSTNDYSQQDVDYPKPARDNWWVDHFNLDIGLGSPDGAADFTTPDTVFMGQDSVTYLLKDGYYIAYDKLHRWWSEPQRIADKWAGLTFEAIDAAFTGKDGRTYLFSSRDQVYARYTDPHFNRLDDRYPKAVDSFWGQVRNNIEETNKIDAAAVMEFEETLTVNGQDRKLTHRHTYLFSGNQFFRYTGETYDYVDEGYPKAIATSLKDEPRFKTLGIMLETGFETLDIDLATGLDAVFADRRNVYLFKGERCIVLSDTDYRQYDTPDQQTLNAVVQEDGVLYVQRQGADGWSVLKDLEGDPAIVPAVAPPLIKAAPAPFKDDIDTAFVGTDQTTYIFKDNQCYNSALEKAYPIHEEWGRVRNNITVDNRIDAAFVGADGKTYLFSGNQYVTYTSSEENSHVLPPFVDEHPNAIQADFGGLTNVNLAFIKAGKTYLLEAPDSTGQFRYICYSSDDYSQPDGVPQVADISWWEFPSIYVEEGFDRVDAVLIDDEHMFLFKGNQFIQYNQTEDLWTYPRPVDLIWRGLPFNDETGQEIVTVFKGIDTVTYFFSDGHVTHDASPDRPFTSPEEIRLRWGQTRNTILQNNRVDAAVVVDNQITYLFSGDQYVRYSTPDYRFIDDGYPKTIVKNLRQEDGFTHLPDSFDDRLKALQQASGGLSGLIAHERNIYIFETQHYHVVSRHLSGQFDIHRLGGLKNQLQTRNQVDAAFVNTDNQQTFLFSGDQYVRYSGTNYGAVDDGYPKSIASLFTTEGLGTAAEGFAAAAVDLDAAVWISSGKLYLFKSDTVYTAVSTNAGGQNDRLTLARLIPSQENRFNEGVDTAFVGPDGNTYFFKDDQYLRYGDLANEFVDGGFPRAIKDHWGNLPAAFEASIDHAFTFEGKTYFVKGDEYVRYSDDGYQRVDPIYPQKFVFRWGDWSDYFLSDIHVIAEFKAALEHNLSQDYTLSDLLNLEVGYKKEPYKMLSDIFGWAIEDVKWLKRKNAFYKDETEVEVNYNLELILKMQDIFHLSDKLFTTPQSLYEVIYKNDFDPGGQTTQVAQTLYRWLGLKHSPQDWQRLSKELHDQLNLIKQAVLLPYAIANDPDVEDSRSLFAKLLIDVNIGSEVMTSRIKEAIAAIQLYLHRYFVNLESIDLKDNASRDQLKQWWQWMRNYRIWEANRKAFLYPENYIRPELRNTKTPAFKELEDALLQGDMTQDLAATAFNDYLTEFSQVGNLKITGANVYDNGDNLIDKMLVLFGHTRTEPTQYYYRTAQFLNSGRAVWHNWQPVNISINSTRVFPVYAFGRILVFWTEIEAYEESVPFVRSRPAQAGSTSKVEETDTVLKHRAAIKYSFHNFNQQWINPQTLKQGIELEYRVDAAYIDKATQTLRVFSGEYCLTSTPQNPQGDIRKISEVYPGLPTEFQHGIDAAVQTADRVIFFRDDQCAIKDDTADWKGESIATMFTSDLKLEEHPLFGTLGWSYYVVPNEQDKPYQQGIAATFTVEDKICLIDHQGLPRFFKYDSKSEGYQEENITDLETVTNGVIHKRPNSLIKEFIKILTHNFLRLEPVDAVFEDETGIVYVLRKGQYECYRHNDDDAFSKLEKLDGFPKPIKGNLSFNLDKFFNKLHVVATADTPADAVAETAQTFVSLTYNSPKKDTALLTGKVFDDFTFEAGEIRTDPLKYKLLRILPGTFRLPSPANSPAVISQFFVTLTAKINRALAEVKRLEALEQALPNIERVLDDIRQIITDQEAQSEGRIAVSSDFQETFNRLMDGDGGIIAVVDNGRGTVAQALKTAFITFVNSDRDDGWQTAFSQLTNASRQLEVTVERVQDALPARLAALQATITPDDITQSQTYLKNYRHDQAMLNRRHREIAAVLDYAERLLPTSTAPQGPATRALNAFETSLATAETSASHWVSTAQAVPGQQTARELRLQLRNAKQALTPFQETLTTLNNTAQRARENLNPSLTTVQSRAYNLRERYFGNFDSFPIEFGITDNQTNFTFGEPDWHIFEAKQGTFLCRPRVGNTVDEADEIGEINPLLTYDIIRLTTTTIPKLSRNLFSGGIDSLLTLASQLEDEQPSFQLDSPPDNPDSPIDSNGQSGSGQRANSDQVIRYSHSRINSVPNSTTLDYKSANANYYWEIFFHAPSLIAQALNHAQKFEEAKRWYEYIFDPTFLADADIAENLQAESIQDAHWRFLPFARVDASLETHLEDHLHRRLDIADLDAEIYAYLNDPFDFHAIARIRETAYQKAIMMAYIDNLLDWGDMLFGQHTIESINEARMLYILAYDLLGNKPLALGNEILPEVRSYENLLNPDPRETDFLLDTGSVVEPNGAAEITEATEVTELAIATGTVHQTVESPYFFIPDNSQFLDYWNRVEDKLYKIRHNLNIDGVKQALPLFQPSIDPLTVARSIAAGGNLSQIMASTNVTVPHYRFNFMFYKAKELVHRLSQFGGDLLAAIEKQDAEQLSLMQHKQEAVILSLLTNIKKAQIAEAKTSIRSLEASLAMVEANEKYNQDTYETGLIPAEIAQLTLMSAAIVAHAVSAISRTVASFGGAAPDSLIGPFIAGIKIGGEQAYAAASSVAEVSESIGEGLSVGGEIAGIVGQYQRMMDDVKHQVDTAIHDKTQIKAQIEGAELQLKIAEYELAIHEKEIAHHQSISTFMTRKFSNQQLYQWMSGQLSELYYQTYKIAYDMAKAAEKAFQFERGLKESEVNYISGMYWNSQRKGLLAGDSLGLDLERMEQAFIQGDRRRFEISKSISLLELAPLAFLYLKAKGFCEFELSEALFDYDFPGHYCRQIKTLEVSFDAAEGETVNATLTQLNHKTVLEADPKAVKYLLDPKDTPPLTIRSDWRANQQIVLSLVDDYEKGHGLFERRYEDDRYLPFEGTGAVSRWRLELNGKRGAVNLAELLDVTITIKYTALPGGEPFADVVKGLLKPYDTVRYFDLNYDFHDDWIAFLDSEETSLTLTFTPDQFPNLASSRITGLFSKFELRGPGRAVSLMLNNDDTMILRDEQFLETPGLSVRQRGTDWTFTVQGDKANLKTVVLVVGYRADV